MKKVLVAEDNKDNFDLIQMIFDEAPFRCELVRANTGRDVLRMVEEEMPDLILMDIFLSGQMDGRRLSLVVPRASPHQFHEPGGGRRAGTVK